MTKCNLGKNYKKNLIGVLIEIPCGVPSGVPSGVPRGVLIVVPSGVQAEFQLRTIWFFCEENWIVHFLTSVNGILLPKLFWPAVRKNCSSDWIKLLRFEAEGR